MRLFLHCWLVLVIQIFLLFLVHTVYATDYYVSPTGADNNNGSIDNPFKTIRTNVWRLQPGDTMILRGGIYQNDSISPIRSGTSTSPITFKAYPSEVPVLQGSTDQAVYLYDKDYIVLDGINIKDVYGHWVSIWLSSYITIKHCDFSNVTRNIIGLYIIHSDHITIQDCNMDKVHDPATEQDKDMIFVESSHFNVFERLTLTRAPHSLIGLQNATYNVIRNNTLNNVWQKNIGLSSPLTPSVSGHNIVEKNKIYGSRTAIAPGFTGKGAMGVYVNQKGNIIRRNEIYDNANFGILVDGNNSNGNTPVNFNKIYHNTLYKNGLFQGYDASAGISITDFYSNINMSNNTIKNNILSENDRYNLYINSRQQQLDNNGIEGNCFYRPTNSNVLIKTEGIGSTNLSFYEQTFPLLVNRNVEGNPYFIGSENSPPDFRLQNQSQCINKAVALTTTTSAGSGTVISVKDAGYFSDGFGIVESDEIQIGSNLPARIIDVDYEANTITIDRSLNWKSGDSVNQPFNGLGPDIGAYELETPTLISPTSTPRLGDGNGDNKVNGQDYIVWLNHYGELISGNNNGDFNNDGKTDGVDYIVWLNNYQF